MGGLVVVPVGDAEVGTDVGWRPGGRWSSLGGVEEASGVGAGRGIVEKRGRRRAGKRVVVRVWVVLPWSRGRRRQRRVEVIVGKRLVRVRVLVVRVVRGASVVLRSGRHGGGLRLTACNFAFTGGVVGAERLHSSRGRVRERAATGAGGATAAWCPWTALEQQSP